MAKKSSPYYSYTGDDGFMAKCRVVWSENDPTRIRFMVSADEMTDENGEKAGMQLVFASNPKSADYNPGYFNRSVRWLKLHDLPHPPEVPMRSRRLADRIAALLK